MIGTVTGAFTHRVLPYAGVDEYLDGAIPFVREGIAAGDRVVCVSTVGREELLRDELGAAAGEVEFVDAAAWYGHPSRTLADCLSDADASAGEGRRLRLLGEPVWAFRSPLEVLEWQRAEAILNVAFRDTGASLLCPYAASLPPGVVAAARKTHPETVRGDRASANPGFVDPWAFSAQCDDEPLPSPPDGTFALRIERPDLYWLRAYVADQVRHTALSGEDLQRLLVAVTEVVTNALRHGEPPIALRVWTRVDAGERSLVCEVTDAGSWRDGSGYGLIPPRPDRRTAAQGRFGLWAVRLLCSLVQIRTGEAGTTVRMWLRLPGRDGA